MTESRQQEGAADAERFLRNLRAEQDGAALYRALANADPEAGRGRVLRELADVEERHAEVWVGKLREIGVDPPTPSPSARVRILSWLARRFGVGSVLPTIQMIEGGDASSYAGQPDAADLARDEVSHSRIFAQLGKAASGPAIAESERWHRTDSGGGLRAAIFGINDGLVSNMSLIMGVAGANAESHWVLLSGLAGLLAGAFSMAAGEYVSIRSQRELFERQVELEKEELEASPDQEREELALIYQAKGVPKEDAERLATTLTANQDVALDTLVREELGFDQEALGSPWGAAGSSFAAFAIGATIPVLPWLFTVGLTAVALSAVLSGFALFAVGALLSLFTGRDALFSGGRMLLIGGLAAAGTYLIGSILGVSIGG